MTTLVDAVSAMIELRDVPTQVSAPEIRADGDEKRFVGHAAIFNSRTAIGNPLTWGFYEEIDPGAFTKTLLESDARFLIDHDSRAVVARESAGDLRLSTDKVGLAVDAGLDEELSYVRDLVRNLEKRRITGMSFGFYVVKDRWTTETVETSDGMTAEVEVRTILEVRLIEVSVVTFPAYPDTDAGVRSMVEEVRAARLGDKSSRDSGGSEQQSDDTQVAPEPSSEGARNDTGEPAEEATHASGDRYRELAVRFSL